MNIVHVCDGWQENNGAAVIARLLGDEQARRGAHVARRRFARIAELRAADEVWIHCGWKPCLWWAALWARRAKWVPEACYDPVRRAYHGWKKRLVGPIERWALRRMDAVVATCAAEEAWIRSYEPNVRAVVQEDIRRFFGLDAPARALPTTRPCHMLYLGRPHPLKGLDVLERAREGLPLELRIVSTARGAEKERQFAWADLLVLPTLSDNFGLVVAEALERGLHVLTTDGAPVWLDGDYGGKLTCIRGYRDATPDVRVQLLRHHLIRYTTPKI